MAFSLVFSLLLAVVFSVFSLRLVFQGLRFISGLIVRAIIIFSLVFILQQSFDFYTGHQTFPAQPPNVQHHDPARAARTDPAFVVWARNGYALARQVDGPAISSYLSSITASLEAPYSLLRHSICDGHFKQHWLCSNFTADASGNSTGHSVVHDLAVDAEAEGDVDSRGPS